MIVETKRQASFGEIVAEMDRRGRVIESLEAKLSDLIELIRDIDAVAIDFGHYESAARAMKEIAAKALSDQQPKCNGFEVEPGVFSGCDQSGGDCPICGK